MKQDTNKANDLRLRIYKNQYIWLKHQETCLMRLMISQLKLREIWCNKEGQRRLLFPNATFQIVGNKYVMGNFTNIS